MSRSESEKVLREFQALPRHYGISIRSRVRHISGHFCNRLAQTSIAFNAYLIVQICTAQALHNRHIETETWGNQSKVRRRWQEDRQRRQIFPTFSAIRVSLTLKNHFHFLVPKKKRKKLPLVRLPDCQGCEFLFRSHKSADGSQAELLETENFLAARDCCTHCCLPLRWPLREWILSCDARWQANFSSGIILQSIGILVKLRQQAMKLN